MSLRYAVPVGVTEPSGDLWPEKNTAPNPERLSKMRRRAHEDESFRNVEVVLVNPAAACSHRVEGRRRRCRLPNLFLILLALVLLLVLAYVADYQPMESASERAQRLREAKQRLEEAAFSKELWADVLRRRLQEQMAMGRPRTFSPSAHAGELVAEAARRNGAAAAELGESQDDEEEDGGLVSTSTTTTTTLSPPSTPSSSATLTVAAVNTSGSNGALRIPPKGSRKASDTTVVGQA